MSSAPEADILPPELGMDTSIGDLIKESGEEEVFIKNAVADVQKTSDQINAIAAARVQGQTKAAKDAAVVTATQGRGKLITQDALRTYADRQGVNLEDVANNLLDKLGTAKTAAYKDANATVDTMLARDKAAGNNIFARMGAKFKDRQDSRVLTDQTEKIKLIESQEASIHSALQNNEKSQGSLSPVLSAGAVESATRLAAQVYQDKALEISHQNQLSNLDALKTIFSMNEAGLTNKMQLYQTAAMTEERAYKRALVEEAANMRLERLKAQKESDAANASAVSYVQFGLGVLDKGGGGTKLPPDKILQFLKMKDPIYEQAFKIGMRKAAFPDDPAVISEDPAEAISIIQSTGAKLPKEMQTTVDQMNESAADAVQGFQLNNVGGKLAVPGFNAKNPAEVRALIGSNIKNNAAAKARNIDYKDAGNPYQSFDLPTLLKMQGLQGNTLVEKILKPEVEAGMIENNPQEVIDKTIKAVAGGKIGFNDAVRGIHLLYNGAIKLNNASKNYQAVGYPEQTSYITHLKLKNSGFGGGKKVDLSNINDVNNMLIESLVMSPGERVMVK